MKKQTAQKKPTFRSSLFWDVDPKTIHPKKNATYIIERVTTLGNDKEARWLWETYPRTVLNKTIRHSRRVDERTRALWLALTK